MILPGHWNVNNKHFGTSLYKKPDPHQMVSIHAVGYIYVKVQFPTFMSNGYAHNTHTHTHEGFYIKLSTWRQNMKPTLPIQPIIITCSFTCVCVICCVHTKLHTIHIKNKQGHYELQTCTAFLLNLSQQNTFTALVMILGISKPNGYTELSTAGNAMPSVNQQHVNSINEAEAWHNTPLHVGLWISLSFV